jgi:hypothetical protein
MPARAALIAAKVRWGEYSSPATMTGKHNAQSTMAKTIFKVATGVMGSPNVKK